jgi:HPt (histidine-containing phosphotransfer) domain-containing protein
MSGFVSKPVTPLALAEALKQWLPHETKESGATTFALPVWDKPAMIERLMQDEGLARAITDAFLSDIPKQIRELKTCLENGNRSGIERQAHSIKGASANVSGEALSAVAREMEKAAKAGEVASLGALMSALEAQYARLQAAMEAYRKTWGAEPCAS